jgi:hypothetical protein
MYFDEWIKPIFDSENFYISVSDACMDLFSVIMHFENDPDYDDLMKKLIRFITKKLDNSLYEELFDQIMEKFENFRTNEFILDLFRHHLRWLNGQIGPFSEFSWRMPEANVPEHKTIEEFLKSNDQQKIFNINFWSVAFANRFAKRISENKYSYSAEAKVNGKGRSLSVEITKTNEWYNKKAAQLSDYFKRRDNLKALNLNL